MAEGTSARRIDPALASYLAFVATLPLAIPALSVAGTFAQVGDVFLGLAYLALLVRLVRERSRGAGLGLLVAALVLLAALALSIVRAPYADAGNWAKLAAFASFALLPWLSVNILTAPRYLTFAVRAFLVGAGAAIVVGVVTIPAFYVARSFTVDHLMCGYGRIGPGPFPRLCAPFRNPNLFADQLIVAMALLVGCGGVLLRGRARTLAILACAVVAAFTLSSGIGGVALAGAGASFAARRAEGGRPGAAGVALGLAAVVVASGFALATVGHRVPAGRGQIRLGSEEWHFLKGPRVATWLSAAGTVERYPVTGIGYGNLVARKPDLERWLTEPMLAPFRAPFATRNLEAHDLWLNVAGQSGLVGLAAFAFLLWRVLRGASIRPLPGGGPLAALPAAALLAAVGAIGFHGLFAGVEEFRHVWVLLGLLAAATAVRAGWPEPAATSGPPP